MPLPTAQYRQLFDSIAEHYELPFSVPGALAEAVAWHESRGKVDAVRYEPHQDTPARKLSEKDADKPGLDEGWIEDDKSYGLMQIMGSNVRRLSGLPAGAQSLTDFRWILEPPHNIAMGCRMLRDLHRTLYRVADNNRRLLTMLARYNGGAKGNPDNKGRLRTAGYCGKVLRALIEVVDDRGGALKIGSPALLESLLRSLGSLKA